MLTLENNGRLIVKGEIAVDGAKFPALRRALVRGRDLVANHMDGWARVAELRRGGQAQEADRLVKDLLGVKGDPMPDEVKAQLRERRAAMTDEEKRAEREKRKADRVLKRLAARAAGNGNPKPLEDAMAKKTGAQSVKTVKSAAKAKKLKAPRAAKVPKERDPRLPTPGSTIARKYKGKDLSVKVLDAGFEFEGETYTSLTALALKITGAKAISGPAFFKLTEPKPAETK